jgi:predicted RNA-binding protein with PUA-like domain
MGNRDEIGETASTALRGDGSQERNTGVAAPVAKQKDSEPGLWLFKSEPNCYNFRQLEQDGRTLWDGITNALARQNLNKVRKGDRVLYYHTGKEKAIVGEMTVLSNPFVPAGSADPRAVVVEVQPVRRWPHPLTLQSIKADKVLADWELVRLPRLSVVPITRIQWKRLEDLVQD